MKYVMLMFALTAASSATSQQGWVLGFTCGQYDSKIEEERCHRSGLAILLDALGREK